MAETPEGAQIDWPWFQVFMTGRMWQNSPGCMRRWKILFTSWWTQKQRGRDQRLGINLKAHPKGFPATARPHFPMLLEVPKMPSPSGDLVFER